MNIIITMNIYITKENVAYLKSIEGSMSGRVNRLLDKDRGKGYPDIESTLPNDKKLSEKELETTLKAARSASERVAEIDETIVKPAEAAAEAHTANMSKIIKTRMDVQAAVKPLQKPASLSLCVHGFKKGECNAKAKDCEYSRYSKGKKK